MLAPALFAKMLRDSIVHLPASGGIVRSCVSQYLRSLGSEERSQPPQAAFDKGRATRTCRWAAWDVGCYHPSVAPPAAPKVSCRNDGAMLIPLYKCLGRQCLPITPAVAKGFAMSMTRLPKYALPCALVVAGGCLLTSASAHAETVTMTPDDDWSILESAQAGDIVEIAPGTYRFRVYLSNAGTAEEPIVIRAQDPNNRPVWDLVGEGEDTFVDTWPGSYGAGDAHRGCWQVASEGAHYEISDIVFQNCRASSSAGIRMINSGPVTLRNCLFQHNTNGLTGASEALVVEHSEFFDNGKTLTTGNMTHHLYIFGGAFTLRYSYLHDGHEGQAFHVRARESTLEYNWITRPASYVGDIMSCEQFCGPAPHQQVMLLRGNVIVQGSPANGSQLFALYRDADPDPAARMELNLIHNTIIGTPRSGTHNLVNLRNDSVGTYVRAYNNIIYNVATFAEPAEASASNWGVEGANNWFSDGTAALGGLVDSIVGTEPGFADLGESNYSLLSGGAAVGAAASDVEYPVDREYYLNEDQAMKWRPRATALDLGAFESTNDAAAVGATDEAPLPEPTGAEVGGAGGTGGVDDSTEGQGSAEASGSIPTSEARGGEADDGCSCSVPGHSRTDGSWGAMALLLLAPRRRRTMALHAASPGSPLLRL